MKPVCHSFRPVLAISLAATLLLLAPSSRSQTDLENAIKQFSGETVKGYIQPVADLFGANMHAGYYHTASISQMGLHIELDIVMMAAMVSDDQKNYTAKAPPGFSPAEFTTATVFGQKGSVVNHATIPGLQYKGSDGIFNTSVMPLAVPQLTIGSIYGTEATIRFFALPKIGDDKLPTLTLWGIGARHNVGQYIPGIPLDLAAGIYYSSFTFGDLIDFSGLSIGAHASKSFSVLTLYGGLAWETSTLKLTYTSSDPSFPAGVDISLDGANTFRATLGAGLSLGFLNLFADVNVGSVTNFSGGLGFGF